MNRYSALLTTSIAPYPPTTIVLPSQTSNCTFPVSIPVYLNLLNPGTNAVFPSSLPPTLTTETRFVTSCRTSTMPDTASSASATTDSEVWTSSLSHVPSTVSVWCQNTP
ncbi:hypothetical protein HBI23_093080 [Parastagonospora nodorum]|nr:hypothetical protein HBI23_093080 [Parastagonospora nodorum]